MDRQDKQDLLYLYRTVMAVNNRSKQTQNPVYPVYPCLNPSPPYTGRTVGGSPGPGG